MQKNFAKNRTENPDLELIFENLRNFAEKCRKRAEREKQFFFLGFSTKFCICHKNFEKESARNRCEGGGFSEN